MWKMSTARRNTFLPALGVPSNGSRDHAGLRPLDDGGRSVDHQPDRLYVTSGSAR